MFNTLRKRLTWLYTVTTGCILTLVIAGFLLFRVEESRREQLQQFQNIWTNVSSRMQYGGAIPHSWLSQTEAANHLILHIEENGIPFFYSGSWTPRTSRAVLIGRAKALAEEQGVFSAVAPVSSSTNVTTLMTVDGEDGEQYYAMVLTVSTGKGVKSICAISYISPVFQILKKTVLYLAVMYLFGIIGLFFISWKFVGRSLRPVEESRKKQSEFIAAASHELRSPLAVIRSGTAAIKAKPEESESLLRIMDAECVRMSRLISDMLLLASTDAQTWSIHIEETDLDTLLIDTYESFLPACREKGMELHLELPDDTLPKIQSDSERLKQVLFILLDNAASYSPAGSSVTLAADVISPSKPSRHKRHQVRIQVIDEGPGIPDEVKPHIFERFYRADSSRSKKEHFGLGLSIAKELITLHGGSITVADHDGGGSRFVISLPIS